MPESEIVKRRPGPPLGSQNHLKHGLRACDAGNTDMRRREDKAVAATIKTLEEDLEQDLSASGTGCVRACGVDQHDLHCRMEHVYLRNLRNPRR
jgi:hypothetical protein